MVCNDISSPESCVPSGRSIGIQNEKSLHAAVKKWYARPEDHLEARVDGYIVDIVRENLLIEIQTRNFSAVKSKLGGLLAGHRVLLVYPVSQIKWIVKSATNDVIISRKKSPKSGNVFDLFDELVRIPELINEPNFTIEVLIIEEEELRADDGKGSWRRKGVSIKDRRLISVFNRLRFETKDDFKAILPDDLTDPFTTKDLALKAGIPQSRATRVTYCLKKMGVLKVIGKQKRSFQYVRV